MDVVGAAGEGNLDADLQELAELPRAALPTQEALAVLRTLARSFASAPHETITAPASALPRSGGAPGLRIGATLGEGGMGLVREAEQLSLARDVAVKTLRGERADERAAAQLVREALVTGLLEHPNIVPVHDLRFDEAGLPLVVLKRIRGVAWSELIADPSQIRDRFFARDPLAWHLRVLLRVCRAVELAHRLGIVHRDLKPANVMVGEHDEVYVVDWGVAATLRTDADPRLPRVDAAIVGTPAYMAPEMARGRPEDVSERTDVFLLGAVLFELIVGHPPHRGERFAQVLYQVLRSDVRLPEDVEVPSGLRRIVERALAREPGERFEGVEPFRRALEDYLEHRASVELTREAEAHLARLARAEGEERQRLFGECRFAFQHALRIWSENEEARRGLDAALVTMAQDALERGQPALAEELLADARGVPSELRARLDAALARHREERAILDAIEDERRQMDPRVGRPQRLAFALVIGLAWGIAPLVAVARQHLDRPQRPYELLVWPLTMVLACAIPALAFRSALMRTALNRRLMWTLIGVMAALFVFHAGALIAGLSVAQAQSMDFALFAGAGLAVTLLVDRRFASVVVVYLACFFVASAWPTYRYWALFVGNVNVLVAFLRVWPPWQRSSAS
ncbi:MAG: protein kinase [Myxococcales bacterium]|nr:protein kinase [Myxococcales bacterium]